MRKYDFSGPICQFNGTKIEGNNLAKILAQILGADNKVIPARKAMIWGTSLEKNDILEIDDADKKIIISFIESTETVGNLVKGQLLSVLENEKSES